MQHSPSWEANSFSDSEGNPCISRSPKAHYRIHNMPPLVPIQIKLIHPLLFSSARHILVLSPINTQASQVVSFLHISSKSSTHFSSRIYFYMFRPLQTLWCDHAGNTWWSGDRKTSWSSSSCNILTPPVSSSRLGLKFFLSALLSEALSLCSSLNTTDQVSYQRKSKGEAIFLVIESERFQVKNKKKKNLGKMVVTCS
jgi:hypothetical protein